MSEFRRLSGNPEENEFYTNQFTMFTHISVFFALFALQFSIFQYFAFLQMCRLFFMTRKMKDRVCP